MALSPYEKETQKDLERQGHTGRSNSTLHALNVKENEGMTRSQKLALIAKREAQGKPTLKLRSSL